MIGIFHLRGLPGKIVVSRTIFLITVIVFLIANAISLVNAVKWVNKPFAGFLLTERLNLDYLGLPHWTGVQAGLKFPDKITKANNQRIESINDLERIIANVNIGDPVRYSIKRGERIIEVDVPTMRFHWTDLFIKYGVVYLIGNIYFLLGVVVFVLKPDTVVSWVFLASGIFLGLDYISSFDIVSTHMGFVRVLFLVDTFCAASVIHMSMIFPEKIQFVKRYSRVVYIPYLISTAIVIMLEWFYPSHPFFNTLFALMNFYLAISALSFLSSTIRAYFKTSSSLTKTRARVILFGAALAFPIPAVSPVLSSIGYSLGNVPTILTAIPMIVFPVSIAYAIAKHDLFDVDVYIKRAVGYIIMTVIVAMAYFALQTSISTFVLRPLLGEGVEKVYPILFALLVVFLFNPLNRTVQGWVDKLFYRKKFDYKEAVTSVSNALTSVLDLNEVIGKLIHTVRKKMFIDTAGVVLLESKKLMCQPFFVEDTPENLQDRTRDVSISYDDPLLNLLSKEKRLITRYDIEEDPRYEDIRESCGRSFSEMGATIALPLIYQDQMTGVLALGSKKSGHFYSREDIDLLQTLSNHGAIALENARLVKENMGKVRMEEELKIAHDIQMSMLPAKAPDIDGFKIEGRSIPSREVGGDFYDFIEISGQGNGDKLGIVVGDVTGKGVSAALIMAASRSIYRVLSEELSSVEDLMSVGNNRLSRDIKKGMFVALLYALLDPNKKNLTLANAGQTQPVLCPGDRTRPPFYIDTEGDRFPLGIIKDCSYQETVVPLKEGDTLVFYTDGVVEAMNAGGELYGFERLVASIEEGRGLAADRLLKKLINDILSFAGDVEQHDDITIVVVKVDN